MSPRKKRPLEALTLPETSISSRSLVCLPHELSHSILILNAYLEKKQGLDGPAYHRLMGEWIGTGKTLEADLLAWLTEKWSPSPVHRRHFNLAVKQAEQWKERGVWVVSRYGETPVQRDRGPLPLNPSEAQTDRKPADEEIHGTFPFPCPAILFGTGIPRWSHPRIAFFNSRKPRLIPPHEEWLQALRCILRRLGSLKPALASSTGTLTYDLVAAHAQREGLPLLLVTSDAAEDLHAFSDFPFDGGEGHLSPIVTCRTRAVRCPRSARMVCRDRILASLADIRVVLEIRSGGNLMTVLEALQARQPRQQWIYRPKRRRSENEGNFVLMANLPQWTEPFSLDDPGTVEKERDPDRPTVGPPIPASSIAIAPHPLDPHSIESNPTACRTLDRRHIEPHKIDPHPFEAHPFRPHNIEPRQIAWRNYLYHYTRSCPHPWPGQSRQDYLLALLDGDPFSGHTALDTLIRILTEGRIRAGSKLVRGEQPVISWTSRSPLELDDLRRWNPALIRWTFEPFGIAIEKTELRKQSIKPTIYAGENAYGRLRPADRFRFQRHEPPKCSWIHEREWRLPGDLLLSDIPAGKRFVFVADGKDRNRLEGILGRGSFAVVALSDLG
jgi:hypothetical protein